MHELAKIEADQIFKSFAKISSLCLTVAGVKKCSLVLVNKIIEREQAKIKTLKQTNFEALKQQAKIIDATETIQFYQLVINEINLIK